MAIHKNVERIQGSLIIQRTLGHVGAKSLRRHIMCCGLCVCTGPSLTVMWGGLLTHQLQMCVQDDAFSAP